MKKTRSSIVLALFGALFIILAAASRFVVLPYATKLPSDTDLKISYSGKATMLDAKAIESGQFDRAIVNGIPITIDRRIRVLNSEGDRAVVADDATLRAAGTNLPSSHHYALDRITLEATTPPDGVPVEPAAGLTIGFPVEPKADDSYSYWDYVTHSSAPFKFQGTASRSDREVNVYTTTVNGPVEDQATLSALPASLPKQVLTALAPALPPEVTAKVGPILPALPDPVPFRYAATTTLTAYVDRTTGVVMDARLQQQIVSQVSENGQTIDVVPVLALDASVGPDTQNDLAKLSKTAATALFVLSTIAPPALLVLGVILLIWAYVRRHMPEAADAPVGTDVHAIRRGGAMW